MTDGVHTTATGGSARSQAERRDVRRWESQRVAPALVRLISFLIPFVLGYLVGALVAELLPKPSGWFQTIAWWAAVLTASSAAVAAGRRLARRLLPVAVLMKMSLVFPDNAPSKYRLALKQGSARDLQRRLAEGGSLGSTPAEAAENLLVLMTALNDHDRLTRGHSERVRAYSDLIAIEMGLPESAREKLHWAALVHDVGKLAVSGDILRKDGRPTDEEWQELRGHPAAAAAMLAPLYPWLGGWLSAATQHHERWDGDGYPMGLAGREINLAGRIVAVADAYDTMTSTRSYKTAWSPEQAREELVACAGSQFDPDVVRAFLNVSLGATGRAAGPLTWLAQTPRLAEVLSSATSASGNAVVRVGTVAATGAVAAPAAIATAPAVFDSPEPAPAALAFETTSTTAVTSLPAPTSTTVVVSTVPSSTIAGAPTSLAVVTTTTSTTAAPTTVTSTTTSGPPTTTGPTMTTSTTAAPTTTTTAPTTTTTAPTTTTTAPTTTTTAPTTTTTTTTPAGLLTVTPTAQLTVMPEPGDGVQEGEYTSDAHVFLWVERTGVVLGERLWIRSIPSSETEFDDLWIDSVAGGTTICSALLHADGGAEDSEVTAVISMNREILGVLRSTLSETHWLANTPDQHGYNAFGDSDTIRRLSPTSIEVTAGMDDDDWDQTRIITAC